MKKFENKIHEIRWKNARLIAKALATERGKSTKGISEMADAIDRHPSYMSAIIGDNPTKNVGNKIAKEIEIAGGKAAGWLDINPDSQLGQLFSLAVSADSNETSNISQGRAITGFFPLISNVQAGEFTEHELLSFDEVERYPCTVKCSSNTFVLRVTGDSMEPRFIDGDLIFVDPTRLGPASGKYVVAMLEEANEATFKQYVELDGGKYLKALNPDYPADRRFISINGNCRIVGTVVSVSREL